MGAPMTGPMTGRTVLVTGGTGGIGLATAAVWPVSGPGSGIVGRDRRAHEAAAAEAAARRRR